MEQPVDLALLGGGGAGLAVLHHLARALLAGSAAGAGAGSGGSRRRRGADRRPLRIAVVDPVDRLATTPADRTWCSWHEPASAIALALAPAVQRAWRHVVLVDRAGIPQTLDLAPLRYLMVRSEDWYAMVAEVVETAGEAGLLDLVHVAASAGEVRSGHGEAVVELPTSEVGGQLRASWVLDSRPAPPLRPARSALVQHFAGQRLHTPRRSLDPSRAVLMDFTVPQPAVGLAFGYCLPSDERTALVEYTEFSPAVLRAEEYAGALDAYTRQVFGEDPGGEDVVEHEEFGVIPMTDAIVDAHPGPRWWRIGTAGGAVRPSTGYAFAAMQRQAIAVAGQLVGGFDDAQSRVDRRGLRVPRPYPRRHAWMDSLVLRALLDGSLDGPAFFADLFARHPAARVLRFLDGLSSPADELRVMASAPRAVMLAAAVADVRARGRTPKGGGGP